ncbi:hypothetical protein ACEPAG_2220 [Sanghuangporus baumii]
MDRFATLEPVKLYATAATSTILGRGSQKVSITQGLIGRLPEDLYLSILTYLAIPDIPAFSRTSRRLAELCRDQRVWKARWEMFGIENNNLNLSKTLNELELRAKGKSVARSPKAVSTTVGSLDTGDDEFGDFASASPATIQDLFGAFQGLSLSSHPAALTGSSESDFRQKFIRVHTILKPLLPSFSSAPHLILTSLFPPPSPSLIQQSHTLHLLALYLQPTVRPVRNHEVLYSSLRSAVDRFQANLLSAFDAADSKKDEDAMREAARASWDVWEGHLRNTNLRVSDWEMGRVWAEKREIFYEQDVWNPLDNFTKDNTLDFTAMDTFMDHILNVIRNDGTIAVDVFPKKSYVVLSYADRVAQEVVGEYTTPLLTKAREVSNEAFLRATAAAFKEAWRMVDVLLELKNDDSHVSCTQAEDVVYQMFEQNMDEYLDEEVESVKQAFEVINRDWERKMSAQTGGTNAQTASSAPRFLGSHNPAQMKRTVLASFTDVLLLPVTIVPRTVGAVGAALTTGGTAAVQGISMLNPQRWVTQNSGNMGAEYSRNFDREDGQMVFELGDDEDEDEQGNEDASVNRSSISSFPQTTHDASAISSAPISVRTLSPTPSTATGRNGIVSKNGVAKPSFDKMDLLLSLDVALELIHADRESLKRLETFAGYPGSYGHRVHDTIEEIFILLMQSMSERHISPGFERATEQMRTYKPAEHEETTSVAPLMQFFELVHIGDTIQSMVQVYFDKELATHIDKTDFLNAVVREKKRFENTLDDSVAAGMNAGTDVLMNQVEHIIITRTKTREYYPVDEAALELGPTQGCKEAIACLDLHCKLLRGSTSKEVLQVFYQEVGIRLLAILHRHIKRQIISLAGGFQVIADLNAYHNFISSLKVPSITADFSNLKMLGHVYVVEDAKDLAQIVRDVTRYGGAYRPEDIYEFIQRRADWKKIEKTVDKAMYNLSFREDCIIC